MNNGWIVTKEQRPPIFLDPCMSNAVEVLVKQSDGFYLRDLGWRMSDGYWLVRSMKTMLSPRHEPVYWQPQSALPEGVKLS